MLSIGQFSRACHVSVKTLRHYEKIGLLLPTRVDEWTGYRYYDEGLIDAMLLIQRLKRYGFPLVAIGQILANPAAGPEALRRQRQVLASQLAQQTLVLRELDRHLAAMERTDDIMAYQPEYDITLREVPARPIISRRQRMSVEDYGSVIGRLYEEAARQRIAPDGPPMTIYHSEAFDPEDTDMELALPVPRPEDATRMLPGGLMAVTTHRGSYAQLPEAYGAMARWIASQNLEPDGAPFEIYRQGPGQGDPQDWQTDICFPVRRKNP
ncbi:MAG: MerR family transcriptional regulator [Aristaeellaceae bacterium]